MDTRTHARSFSRYFILLEEEFCSGDFLLSTTPEQPTELLPETRLLFSATLPQLPTLTLTQLPLTPPLPPLLACSPVEEFAAMEFPVFGLLFTVDGFSSSSDADADDVTLLAGDAPADVTDAPADVTDAPADATGAVEMTCSAGKAKAA